VSDINFKQLKATIMKKSYLKLITILAVAFFTFESCGPVVISSRLGTPPPPWFYPNRVETVRYIYFPDYTIYYDLNYRNYRYLDNGVWITLDVLPAKFSHINLRRSKHVRINNYFDDNIQPYHNNRRMPSKRESVKRRK